MNADIIYRSEEEAIWGYILYKLGYHADYYPEHHCFRTNGGVLCRDQTGDYFDHYRINPLYYTDSSIMDMVIIVGDQTDIERSKKAVSLAERISQRENHFTNYQDSPLFLGLGGKAIIVSGVDDSNRYSSTIGCSDDEIKYLIHPYYSFMYIDDDEWENVIGISRNEKIEITSYKDPEDGNYDRFKNLVDEAREHIFKGFAVNKKGV